MSPAQQAFAALAARIADQIEREGYPYRVDQLPLPPPDRRIVLDAHPDLIEETIERQARAIAWDAGHAYRYCADDDQRRTEVGACVGRLVYAAARETLWDAVQDEIDRRHEASADGATGSDWGAQAREAGAAAVGEI